MIDEMKSPSVTQHSGPGTMNSSLCSRNPDYVSLRPRTLVTSGEATSMYVFVAACGLPED